MIRLATCLLVLFSTGAALAAPRVYSIDEARSSASAHVGKTGIASFAGHEHVVLAQKMQGEITFDPERFGQSSVDVVIDAQSLKIREQGEPEGDAPKVQEAMRGPGTLDVAAHRTIHFRSTQVIGRQTGPGAFELSIQGVLSLHGMTRPYVVPVKLEVNGDQLLASGKLTVKLQDFGIEPTTAAGGLVKVENDVPLEFKIAARAAPQ
jgi:polyisoprenoid-binding protein YceI